MRYFVTGSSGFIGFHLAKSMLDQGHEVHGFDSLSNYYDPALKEARTAVLATYPNFKWTHADLCDNEALRAAYADSSFDAVVHLAAQAGVRYSLEAPAEYTRSNVVGTANLLELVGENPPTHFLFASTSSVYGGNELRPFAETHRTYSPVSLYAATKRSGEAMTHAYAHLYGVPTTCFRFFTVYGSWGRPDMALFKFTRAMLAEQEIDVYGRGEMSRDFTHVRDLVRWIFQLIGHPPKLNESISQRDSLSPVAPWRVVNLGKGEPAELRGFISALEQELGVEAKVRLLDMQPGDVRHTHADVTLLGDLVGELRGTSLAEGVSEFVTWYKSYYASASS